ncbi:retrotransposon protein, putative, ty1-copia subclass [Tanacetum coccineum]
MHNIGKTIGELHAMLIEYEKGLPKKAETPQIMVIKGGKIQKAKKKLHKAKGKGKANGKGNDKQEVGHWKRDCPVYLVELLEKKKKVGFASSSDYCHYAPSITRGVVSVYRLAENGFVQCFTDFGISVSKNNVFYFNAIPSNGIYEIDMHDLVLNVNFIYNVSTKRAKHNLDSTFLWHCCLAHISKKRIEKLQQEGLLKSTDDESFDQYVSCLSGKMTRKSFPHRPERATNLLGIIHTDVCSPLRHVSRQGASYFITFTDDYSRYGYVYLLKHKHEVFETFKVLKNEVENQLGKTIKALRSDQGGEYISQEFKDYLKACRIIQQLTPPYTPQHNGVSERRNHTLLDMDTQRKAMEVSGRAIDLEEIQDKDTSLSEITSEILIEVEGFEPPQEEEISICRSERTHRAPDHLCLNVEVEEHSLGDLNEPTSYKAAMLDSESNSFIDPNHPRKVCKLQRSIYGLKQASRSWNKRFDEEIKRFGFDQNFDEQCVYQKASGSNVTFLILYVDDIIIMGNHIPSLQSVKDYLGKCFAMKDLRETTFILRIKIYRDRSKRLNRLGAVDWKSSKQSTTAISTTEAEYIAALEAAIEAVWIKKFISVLGIVPTINEPIRMFCDNSAALHFANEPGVQRGTRHYHKRYHYVRESIALGEIKFLKVHTDDNLADPVIKALSKGKLTQHVRSMRLCLASSFM